MATIKLGNMNAAKAEATVEVGTVAATEQSAQAMCGEKPRVRSAIREGALKEDASILFEDEEKRGRYEAFYRRNNGTIKQVITSNPMHYRGEDGTWKQIDNSLVDKGDRYETKEGKYKISVAKNTAQKGTIALSGDGFSIGWDYLPETQLASQATAVSMSSVNAAARKSVNVLQYKDAAPSVDLEYKILGENIKENIIIREKKEEYRYRFRLNLTGAFPRLSEDTTKIELYKTEGEEKVAEIPAPFMYDAAGDNSDEVYYELEETQEGYDFIIVASSEWVNAAERSFPVTVDPQIITNNNNFCTVSTTELQYYFSQYWWKPIRTYSNSQIVVYARNTFSKHSTVTLNLSKIRKEGWKVTSAKVIFEVTSCNNDTQSYSKNIYINGTGYENLSAGMEISYDITQEMNNGKTTTELMFTPYESSAGSYAWTNIFLSQSTARIEIEYLTDDSVRPVTRTYSLCSGVVSNVNLFTGETTFSITDVPTSEFLLGINISHNFKLTNDNYYCGEGFRLNLHERLDKVSDETIGSNYIYTDVYGTKHGIKDYYLYIENEEKVYIDPKDITIDSEGNAVYNQKPVYKEQRSLSGYRILEDINTFNGATSIKEKIASKGLHPRSKPVIFLTNEVYVKGFNKNGQLVTIFDHYDNSIFLYYNENDQIHYVFDNKDDMLTFDYSENNMLKSITDARRRKISYGYTDNRLTSVTYANGTVLSLSYGNFGNIIKVETSNGESAELDYSGGITKINLLSTAGEITHGKTAIDNVSNSVSCYNFSYSSNKTVVSDDDGRREIYVFESDGNIAEYYEEEGNVVISAEKYHYDAFSSVYVERAKDSLLYLKKYEQFSYEKGDEETTTLNIFNMPVRSETNAVKIDANSTLKLITDYEYDDLNRCIKRKVTKNFVLPSGTKQEVFIAEYQYNANSQIEHMKSYIEGEENISGINYCDYTYDANGYRSGASTYNSLDTSSQYVIENVYLQHGQLWKQKDLEGKEAIEYEYKNGTTLVETEKYISGSSLSYGRKSYDDDRITALSLSLNDGTSMGVQFGLSLGEITQIKNSNTVFEYSYNSKRALSSIKLNGEEYVQYSYSYGSTQDSFTKKVRPRGLSLEWETFTTNFDKHGNIVDIRYGTPTAINTDVMVSNQYEQGRLIESTTKLDVDADILLPLAQRTTDFNYDELGRLISCSNQDVDENYTYNEFGLLNSVSVSGYFTANDPSGFNPVFQTKKQYSYNYVYEDSAQRRLKRVSVRDLDFEYSYDPLGRSVGRTISFNDQKVVEETIEYRKSGQRTTTLTARSSYNVANKPGENILYSYYDTGFLKEIKKSEKILVRYQYDSAGRLKREDNAVLGTSSEFEYDNCGNILSKHSAPYTTEAELSGGTTTDYIYQGDFLTAFGTENIVYDTLGNPIVYRGKTLVWERGWQLKSYDGLQFRYDGYGRRIGKGTLNYLYSSDGKLLWQSDGLEFVYDAYGIAGLIYKNQTYLYKKDILGNIEALLDSSGNVVVQYVYDAWGNHAVLDANGADIADSTHIGNLNPFRYRGYYYDAETGLYYLPHRYYDPETGRWLNSDNILIGLLSVNMVEAVNLYAYCFNNPVEFVDYGGLFPKNNKKNRRDPNSPNRGAYSSGSRDFGDKKGIHGRIDSIGTDAEHIHVLFPNTKEEFSWNQWGEQHDKLETKPKDSLNDTQKKNLRKALPGFKLPQRYIDKYFKDLFCLLSEFRLPNVFAFPLPRTRKTQAISEPYPTEALPRVFIFALPKRSTDDQVIIDPLPPDREPGAEIYPNPDSGEDIATGVWVAVGIFAAACIIGAFFTGGQTLLGLAFM